jgi:GNAT superfamily N-acetyltransferase
MTQTLPTRRSETVTVRGYRATDHHACRQLWAELTSEHRARYPGHADSGTVDAGSASGAGADQAVEGLAPTGLPAAGIRGMTAPGGAADPGAGFEEYLTRLDLSGMWVALHPEAGVVGFAGLILRGRSGSIDPVVVTARLRDRGIGRALLAYVAEEARGRGLRELSISPSLRNVEAIHCLYRAGYDMAASVTLTLDLTGRRQPGGEAIDLHGVRFGY